MCNFIMETRWFLINLIKGTELKACDEQAKKARREETENKGAILIYAK